MHVYPEATYALRDSNRVVYANALNLVGGRINDSREHFFFKDCAQFSGSIARSGNSFTPFGIIDLDGICKGSRNCVDGSL